MTLISVGNVVIDVPALPERGGDVLGRATGSTPGGSFNTMVAATRQGLATAYGGAHGTGPFGDRVRAALAAEGIGVLQHPTADTDTGYDIALTESDGERTFVTVFGAEASLTAEALAGIRIAEGDLVHVSGYGLLESTNGRLGWRRHSGAGRSGAVGGRHPPRCLGCRAGQGRLGQLQSARGAADDR